MHGYNVKCPVDAEALLKVTSIYLGCRSGDISEQCKVVT